MPGPEPEGNAAVAARLAELADVLERRGANLFRVGAYRRAAATLRRLDRPVAALLQEGGLGALETLPGIGPHLSRSIRSVLETGRLPMLERLRAGEDPVERLTSVPGVGRLTAERVHDELGIGTLEQLEAAAWDGRLRRLPGIGPKRLAGIRDSLAQRLSRVRSTPAGPPRPEPSVAELLAVDGEYRRAAEAGRLPRIAPRRLNPSGEAWLPILEVRRGRWRWTALFSNTPRAHQLGRTRDWVVLEFDDGGGGRQRTVVTARRGPLEGRRVVRGREAESAAHYRDDPAAA